MTAPAILVIGHGARLPLGRLGRMARAYGLAPLVVRPVLGERLPASLDGYAGVVVLGGPQSAAHDVARHPYLADEIAFLAAAHRARVPVLGICLGSQLLATALGGAALPGDSGLECGFIEVLPVGEEGAKVAGRYFSFHSDTFRLPEGATLLGKTDRYPQAWRLDGSLALQFHPELDRAGVEAVLDIETEKLTSSGIDVDFLRKENAEELRALQDGVRLIDRWMERRAPVLTSPADPLSQEIPCQRSSSASIPSTPPISSPQQSGPSRPLTARESRSSGSSGLTSTACCAARR